ncbi:MAG: 7TM diverse intracellular signaling domain-containing protein [Ferruginibacter sp.]
MKKNLFLYFFLLFSFSVTSQTLPDSLRVNVDSIINSASITTKTFIFFDSLTEYPFTPIEKVSAETFVPLKSYEARKAIPNRLVTKPVYLAFKLENTGNETVSLYFFPGSLYSNLQLYKKREPASLQAIEYQNTKSGFVHLTLLPKERITYVVRLQFCKTIFNDINARLITEDFLPYFKMEQDNDFNDRKTVGLILSGILVMMILFTMVNYFLTGRMEFLYNFLYTICMFLLIFFTAYLPESAGRFKVFFIAYFDLFLLIVGTIFYLAFTRKFLNTKEDHPKLNRFLFTEQWVLIVFMVAYTILHYFTDLFVWQMRLENILKFIVLIAGIIYIIIAFVEKNKLMNYLAIGTAAQILFSIFSFILILAGISSQNIFTSSIFYFEVGVILSVIFFLLGLTYKNRQELIVKIKEQEAMKLEVEKKSFETRLAIINAQQEERNRISADMHDDLGSGMTTIRLYSELAKNKIGDNVIPEIDKISTSASELIDKMNAIIWSMSSSNDSLGNMIAYIRSYALEYFENFPAITCKIYIPERLPELEVNGEIRRNVFLVIKEALHNIVKHAQATTVTINLNKEPKGLSLTIQDNGKGIDMENVRSFGNGLKNMKKRMEALDISFSIENNNGTLIKMYRQTLD